MKPPDSLSPFLTSDGSLTALLERHAGRILMVKVIKEGFEPLDFYHKKLLNQPTHRPQLAWVRHVELFGDDGTAWVRAKSVFPLTSLIGNAKRLRHLKRTPIGYVMFKHNKNLPHRRTYFFDEHWGRHTVYEWDGRPLLISETFLPAFLVTLRPSSAPQKPLKTA